MALGSGNTGARIFVAGGEGNNPTVSDRLLLAALAPALRGDLPSDPFWGLPRGAWAGPLLVLSDDET